MKKARWINGICLIGPWGKTSTTKQSNTSKKNIEIRNYHKYIINHINIIAKEKKK